MKNLNRKGFTIVELVIVIAVIAILASVLIPTFNSVISKANESAAMSKARGAMEIVSSHDKGLQGVYFFVIDPNEAGTEGEYIYCYDPEHKGADEKIEALYNTEKTKLADCDNYDGSKFAKVEDLTKDEQSDIGDGVTIYRPKKANNNESSGTSSN